MRAARPRRRFDAYEGGVSWKSRAARLDELAAPSASLIGVALIHADRVEPGDSGGTRGRRARDEQARRRRSRNRQPRIAAGSEPDRDWRLKASGRAQVIIATHSTDVLLGLLDAQDADVTIVRMTRRDAVNLVAILPHEQLRELCRDPLLRYSNILDGLFHRGVILCEADSDARYYGAVLNESRARRGLGPHDLLLTYSSGIARLAMVVRALAAVDVPAVVIVDLDALRDENGRRTLVTALGGDWDQLRRDWQVVNAAVQGLARNPSLAFVQERVGQLLGEVEGGTLPAATSEGVREATRVADGWTQAKRGGVRAVPQGDAAESCQRLLDALKTIGLFVVAVGELERWEPAVPHHGTAWVNEVLDRNLHANPTNGSDAFIEEVASSFD